MHRRTLARRNSLLTFAAQPWNLFEDDPTAGGGGGGGTAVNEHGYPDNTPTADMTPEHQVAYWKHHARKHEAAAKSAPDAAELERLRAAEAELATRKAAELTETERLQKERDDAAALAAANAAKAAEATAELLKLQVAAEKQLTPLRRRGSAAQRRRSWRPAPLSSWRTSARPLSAPLRLRPAWAETAGATSEAALRT
jgi:hypothetical protein